MRLLCDILKGIHESLLTIEVCLCFIGVSMILWVWGRTHGILPWKLYIMKLWIQRNSIRAFDEELLFSIKYFHFYIFNVLDNVTFGCDKSKHMNINLVTHQVAVQLLYRFMSKIKSAVKPLQSSDQKTLLLVNWHLTTSTELLA